MENVTVPGYVAKLPPAERVGVVRAQHLRAATHYEEKAKQYVGEGVSEGYARSARRSRALLEATARGGPVATSQGLRDALASQSKIAGEYRRKNTSVIQDVFHPARLNILKEQLVESQGRALFVVHPFFEVGAYQGDQKKYMDTLLNDPKSDTAQFWKKLGGLLEKMDANNIPIIVLQEVPYLGDLTMSSTSDIEETHAHFTRYLSAVSEVDPARIHLAYTERGGPHPLRTEEESGLSEKDFVKNRMSMLKDIGIKTAYVAGMLFKPGEGDNYEYYASADTPMDGFKKNAYEEMYGAWKLQDYYLYLNKPNHPLAKIRPDQCVGEFIRMLAVNGIRPAITLATFPDQLGRSSDYQEVEYQAQFQGKYNGPKMTVYKREPRK